MKVLQPTTTAALSAKAAELHADAIVIDLHADTFEIVQLFGYDLALEHRSTLWSGRRLGHVDIPRMRRGGITAQIFGVVIPPLFSPERAHRKIERQGNLVTETCERLSDDLVRVHTAEEVLAAHREGKIGVMIGVEGSHGMDDNLPALDELVRQRVRYMGPAHLFESKVVPSNRRGNDSPITAVGWRVIEGLRQRSVIVDLAHMARGPFMEICRSTTQPLLVSHTGLAALKPMWRNIDDEQIRAVADTGGVIGIIMTKQYLGRPGAEGVVDHLEHLLEVGGEDVAALGSDFDGLVRPPKDIRDASGLPRITEVLLERGHSASGIRKILGENALRLLAEVPPPERVFL